MFFVTKGEVVTQFKKVGRWERVSIVIVEKWVISQGLQHDEVMFVPCSEMSIRLTPTYTYMYVYIFREQKRKMMCICIYDVIKVFIISMHMKQCDLRPMCIGNKPHQHSTKFRLHTVPASFTIAIRLASFCFLILSRSSACFASCLSYSCLSVS